MINPNEEKIWQGLIHIGDEPGVYGAAAFAGLATEFPITIHRTPQAASGSDFVKLILVTEEVKSYAPYLGHDMVAIVYEPDATNPTHWKVHSRTTTKIASSAAPVSVDVDLSTVTTDPIYVSLLVRSDTEVTPGFYDDFLITRLSLLADQYRYYASFGFR
jgi:hypothetical protein